MNTNEQDKIKSFTNLTSWKEAHKLALEVYKLTKVFPNEEKYVLIDQMRRCAVSISSNIAEGFARRSRKEKINFYFTAKGSLTELQNQLIISRDLSYTKEELFMKVAKQTVVVHKLINGLVKSAQSK